MENTVGVSYSDASIQLRKNFREKLIYNLAPQYKDKNEFFQILLKIDEVQDTNHKNKDIIHSKINNTLLELSEKPEKLILQQWKDAVTTEYKAFILTKLKDATAGNLNKTTWERAQPFLWVIVLPICLYFVNIFTLHDETSTDSVTSQQTHTMPFDELYDFTNQFSNTLFSAANCFPINSTNLCNITRFSIETQAKTSVYNSYIETTIVLIVSILGFGQQLIHEMFYFIYQYRDQIPLTQYERKNIEVTDSEVVDAVYEELVCMNKESSNKTLTSISSFLPDLLKKRTYGFTRLLKDRIQQINK